MSHTPYEHIALRLYVFCCGNSIFAALYREFELEHVTSQISVCEGMCDF